MKNMHLTDMFVLLVIAICIIYDVFAYFYFGNSGTISIRVQCACERDYKWAILAGMLVGHVFLSTHFNRNY